MKKILTIIIAVTMILFISLPFMAEETETHRAVYLGGNDFFVESTENNFRNSNTEPLPVSILVVMWNC